MSNEMTLNEPLDITGTAANTNAAGKFLGAIALVGLGIFLWTRMETVDEEQIWWGIGGGLAFLFAAWVPYNRHIYVDFTAGEIVTAKHYLWFELSEECQPLTDFNRIVVRHLCHSPGEGADTYTGSVGLKPKNGQPVLWMKNFPATEDEVPREAYEFARRLQELTGLPGGFMGETQSD